MVIVTSIRNNYDLRYFCLQNLHSVYTHALLLMLLDFYRQKSHVFHSSAMKMDFKSLLYKCSYSTKE